MTAKTQSENGRRGVALIVVLGFLSIMVMMAVAFITQARTERMVAGASLEGMRTRQMAQTAMAAAMQDYLNALKSVSPSETKHDIFLSGDGAGSLQFYFSGQTIGDDRLLVGKVEDWLLDRHLAAALGGGAQDGVRNAEWIWVRQQPGARSRILGRYAYACFDMSGLLDANLLGTKYGTAVPAAYQDGGDTTNRNNVRKMLLDATVPENGYNDQQNLSVHQERWIGFDTPAALLNLTDGDWNDGRNTGANRWLGTDMDEGDAISNKFLPALSAYSYSVLHRLDGSGKAKVMCTSADIQSDAGFNALTGGNRDNVVKAMADYEDADSLPQGGTPDYPSVEAVPMFNEIGVMAELKGTPAGNGTNGLPAFRYNLVLHVKIEFWYPFPSADNNQGKTFTMELPKIGASKNATGSEAIWVQLAGSSGGMIELRSQTGAATTDPAAPLQVQAKFQNDNKPYFAANANADNELVYTVPLEKINGDQLLPDNMQLVVRNVQISKPLLLNDSADSSPLDKALDFSFRGTAPLPNNGQTAWQSLAVEDPRMNHDFASWLVEDPPTFGEINKAAKDAIAKITDIPPGNYFYCRNGAIERPGELGYLPAGTAWQTLDIFHEEGVQLMNRLVCDPEVFSLLQKNQAFFTNGTINPYTRDTNVLNAAFFGLDIREVPNMDGEPEDDEKLVANLDDVVTAMMEKVPRNGYAGWSAILGSENLTDDLNKNNRIAILNDTWGLFNESDRLFVVVVVAQSIKEGENEGDPGFANWDPNLDVITGERRAVALCWMDGSADVGGNTAIQEMNVIMFQYLNE